MAAIKLDDFGPDGVCGPGSAGFDASAPLIAAFMETKRELHQADTERFPRTMLVAAASSWVLDGGAAGDAGDQILRKLRDFYASSVRRAATASDDLAAELIKELPVPLAPLLSLVFVLLRRSGSQLWCWGVPGFRPDCRWLRRQWRSHEDGATFKTFALALTLGARRRPAPGRDAPGGAAHPHLRPGRPASVRVLQPQPLPAGSHPHHGQERRCLSGQVELTG
jgi:hypothetical protein